MLGHCVRLFFSLATYYGIILWAAFEKNTVFAFTVAGVATIAFIIWWAWLWWVYFDNRDDDSGWEHNRQEPHDPHEYPLAG